MDDTARRPYALAAALAALGLGFNLPYAWLAGHFDYPDILRRPAGEVLAAYAQAGPTIVLVWYVFALSALAMVPVALAYHARARGRAHAGAALAFGVIAGLTQGVGLLRWALVVPVLARLEIDPATDPATRAAARVAFEVIGAYGGVAIGEHLGQLATAGWIGLIALGLRGVAGAGLSRTLGLATAAVLVVGTAEALVLALGLTPGALGLVTVLGFALVTLWLLVEAARLIEAPSPPRRPVLPRRGAAPGTPPDPRTARDQNITPQ